MLDGLYELQQAGDISAGVALTRQLALFLNDQKGIVYENSMTVPIDGSFNNIEDFLPFACVAALLPTGIGLDMVEFLTLSEPRIPNLRGIKYTANTLWEYQACLNHDGGRYDMLYGYDEMLLPALSVGAKAAIGSTYNFAAPLYLDVMAAYRAGELERAQRGMNALVSMVRVLVKFPPIPAQKAIMQMLGYDLGPCRLPLKQLTGSQHAQLQAELEQLGFLAQVAHRRQAVLSGVTC